MSEPAITIDTVMAGRLRDAGHGDGKDWFATFWQHTTIPRLQAMDKHPRRGWGGKSERIWQVDGRDCASLHEAVERLNEPAVASPAEAAILAHVPAEWVELNPFMHERAREMAPPDTPLGLIMGLRFKGFVEVERREDVRKSFIRRAPDATEQAGGWHAS